MADQGIFTIRTRRDTAANWTANDPVLAEGEEGLEMDTLQYKVGDGITQWSLLPYWKALISVRTITAATYELQVVDNDAILLFTNPLGCIITLPNFTDVAIPVGFITHVHQDAAVELELVAASGVTTKTAIGLKTRVQNSSLSIINQAQNVFKIIGDAKA